MHMESALALYSEWHNQFMAEPFSSPDRCSAALYTDQVRNTLCIKKMNLLIVADIFGRTQALDILTNYFKDKKIKVEIIDPYRSQYRNFEMEENAYKAFQAEIGLSQYTKLLKEQLNTNNTEKTVILGFSVGASALWAASPYLEGKIYKGICFYSSQIRRFLDIEPNIEIELYFAKSEPSYEVDKVARYYENLKNVKCIKTQYMHGFMNKLSKNFNVAGYYNYIEIIENCITNHSTGLAEARR